MSGLTEGVRAERWDKRRHTMGNLRLPETIEKPEWIAIQDD